MVGDTNARVIIVGRKKVKSGTFTGNGSNTITVSGIGFLPSQVFIQLNTATKPGNYAVFETNNLLASSGMAWGTSTTIIAPLAVTWNLGISSFTATFTTATYKFFSDSTYNYVSIE